MVDLTMEDSAGYADAVTGLGSSTDVGLLDHRHHAEVEPVSSLVAAMDSMDASTALHASPKQRRWKKAVLNPPAGSVVELPLPEVSLDDALSLRLYWNIYKLRQEDVALGCSEDGLGIDAPQWALDLFRSFPFTDARVDSFLQTLTSDVVEPDTVDLTEPKCSAPVGMLARADMFLRRPNPKPGHKGLFLGMFLVRFIVNDCMYTVVEMFASAFPLCVTWCAPHHRRI